MSKLLSLSLLVLSLIQSGMGCNTVSGIKFTAYGFPDASGTPAYACNGNNPVASQPGGKTVLGDGSFNKPYSAAAATGSIFKECELLYMPLLKKYFRVQDNCSGCVSKQTDLYIAQYNKDVGQTSCENQFGAFDIGKPLHEVVRDPGSGFQTNTQPLFTPGHCYSNPSDGRVFPGQDGHVTCGSNGQEQDVQQDVDGSADTVTPPADPLDKDPKARHKGSGAGRGSSTATTKAGPSVTKRASAFRA